MLNTLLSLEDQCAEIWRATREQKFEQERRRREPPVVRIWDAEWQLQHVISGVEYQASFQWVSNDTGPGQCEIPFDHPAAQWIHDSQGRIDRGEGRNVHITVDFCDTRWSGRMDKAVVETREDGDDVLICDWAHDYENLKFYTVYSNPFLAPAFQFPRAFLLAGPVSWIVLTTLHLQLWRENNPLLTVPDDPLDVDLWDNAFDQSQWQVVVKPTSFAQAAASGVVWGVVSSRWATFHDCVKTLLEDSELSVQCTRYLEGDPLPWDGANLRHGTLVVDVVDKSGVYIGTSNGGTVFDGLARTVAEFAEDFIDSTQNLIDDTETPEEYFIPGLYLTKAEAPYVVYRTGEGSGIQTSRFINSPSKAVQINIGGHSSPGVNEVISASIQAVGDLWGNILLIGGLGGSIDTLLKPLYQDCVDYDTVIDGPDGKERIGVLADQGGPFRVWSLTPTGEKVAATAVFAFRKGTTELFEYVLANGSAIKATRQHRWLTSDGWRETGQAEIGTLVGVDTSEQFSPVVQINPLGRRDFYDMHVPGWENYLAEGIWNHNTILAWQSVKSQQRAQNSGWSRYFEYFQEGANKAFTITALMVLRAGFWSTRTVLANEMTVIDGSPFFVSQNNGHFFLDDRIGFSLENDPTGKIWVDRARKIELKWDAETFPEWVPTIGDPRNLQDPAQRAWGKIESMVAALRDLGVW